MANVKQKIAIISNSDKGQFCEELETYIESGWSMRGSMVVVFSGTTSRTTYHQQLTKLVEE